MNAILVDAGPLVAILNSNDQDHARCIEALKAIRAPLATTWPPLTEAMYLLSFSPAAQDALLQMVERRTLLLLNISAPDLPRIRALIKKYRNLPMDFADATLVRVAEREGIRRVFTLDRRHFGVYRLGPRETAFTIIS